MNDTQIIKFTANFRRGILGHDRSDMMCYAMCVPLITLLKIGTLRQGTAKFGPDECNHFWIELDDGRVLDPTADQFAGHLKRRLPKVYLGAPIPELHSAFPDGQTAKRPASP